MRANLPNSFQVLLTQLELNFNCTTLSQHTARHPRVRPLLCGKCVCVDGTLLCCRQTHTFTSSHTHVCVASNTILDYRGENMLGAQIIDSLLPTSDTATLQVHSRIFHFGLRLSGWRTPLVSELCAIDYVCCVSWNAMLATQSLSFLSICWPMLKFSCAVYFWI